ncbi:ABC transporter ATP-binding protein [Amaricoccus solimangrovi]|uniref:ABC transporter ATP-binding protein n=1 Tax=Amaricoccus solimangrovi TaxID=2589815 RepID=A0A501WVE4_9RHOB|nr:ABC transporter ATP-binding protein [Amaricoccus solimangrovi]TPE52094.1 ABC transporter ATP-binding protein [Amaricoccus solimangrovi]
MKRFFSELIDHTRTAEGPPPDRLWIFLRWALRGALPAVLIGLAISVSVGVTEVLSAQIIGWLIDLAQSSGPADLIARHWHQLLLAMGFFLLLRPALMGAGAAVNALTLNPNLYPLVLSRLNRHTLGQSLSFFDDDFAGRIAQKQQQTARAITEAVSETVNTLGLAVTAIVGAIAVMAGVNLWLGVVMLVWLGGYVVLIRTYMPRIRGGSTARAAARAIVTGQVVDTITNIATVKLFSHGEGEDRATSEALGGYRQAAIRFGTASASFRFWLMTLSGGLPVLLVGGSLLLWTRGAASAGEIATAGMIATRLAQMSGWVSMTAMGIVANFGEIEDGMRTLSPPHRITDASHATPAAAPARGQVDFEEVRFGYGRTRAALDGFTLRVRPGERVALVGRSGAGKTTAVSLLLRLYDVEGGRILLDGADIRDLTQDSLRAQIGVVRQETAMFNRSALENIRYGRPDATIEEVEEAARRAEAHDFILGLRDFKGREGYAAHLGERGVKLSGGQRQRIALARVILKNAPVLVLDEATSALDSEVEAAIQDTLDTVMEGKTVIAIAHRLSTIARMDRIVVLDGGRIVEEGGHTQLLRRGGLYAGFWNRQSGGFIDLAAE